MKDKEKIRGGNVKRDKGKWENMRDVRKQNTEERQTKKRKKKGSVNKSLPQKAMRENVLIEHSEENEPNNTAAELYFPAVTNNSNK